MSLSTPAQLSPDPATPARPRAAGLRHLAAASALAGLLTLAACGGATDSGTDSAGGPLTIENCGEQVTYDGSAQRIVATSNSSNIGTLLRIGAVDQLAAISLSPGNDPVLNELYDVDVSEIDRLKSPISLESVVAADPDLLVGSYSGLFSGSSGVTREAAAEKNVPTYVISDSCRQDPADAASKLGTMGPWDAVRADLTNYGELTGHSEEAEAALAELDERLAVLEEAPQADAAPQVLLFDSATTDVYTSGRNGPPQGIIEAAGAENVFVDEDTTWFRASWETVAAREPDVIVVMDYRSDNPTEVEEKLETIRTHAALKDTAAVRENRIIVLPLVLFTSGYPNIEAAEQLRAGLEDLGLQPETGIAGTLDLS
ncbi:MAG: ABC transporter substrate-binding protein [Aeromicrobium sp.]|uniref:ABC transporter substrate-binding protein n=1 Tax=Aeromicrobium sp. TaxID=1871063 RepID=UPI00260B5FDA|nr:ABC transporter substrate-binding protein [Aeromicrobium sp.]MDF1706293.1 ABC transporter substrate-binding protein [Aeromicrobium sp.]